MARSIEVKTYGLSVGQEGICQHSGTPARSNRPEASRVRRDGRHKFINVSGERVDSILRKQAARSPFETSAELHQKYMTLQPL
jgi:hypothetical protein